MPWALFAERAGLSDVPAFEACLAGGDPVGSLERDTLDARSLRISSTPTFMINGVQYLGTPPLETLRAYVRSAVESAPEPGSADAPAAASNSR